MWRRLRDRAAALKRDVVAVWFAAFDRRTPVAARLLALVVAGYALSPIDLIPDVIPVLGYLDDLLIVPAGLWLVIRLIPPVLLAEFRDRASAASRPRSWIAAGIVVIVWAALAALGIGLILSDPLALPNSVGVR